MAATESVSLTTPSVVIDDGSDVCKAGFSGDDAPRAVFPSVVGRPDPSDTRVGSKFKDCFVGDEAKVRKPILELREPREEGNVNWDDQEKIWYHAMYNELRVSPEEQHVLLVENPCVRRVDRERKADILFETFR